MRDVGKCAVTVVAVQMASAEHVRNEDIKPAILIEIEDRYIAAPSNAGQTCLLGDVGKRPIAVVVIEDVVFFGAGKQFGEGGNTRKVAGTGICVFPRPTGSVSD